MKKLMQCVQITKNANGTGAVLFHEKDTDNKVIGVYTWTTQKAEEVNSFEHMKWYNIWTEKNESN